MGSHRTESQSVNIREYLHELHKLLNQHLPETFQELRTMHIKQAARVSRNRDGKQGAETEMSKSIMKSDTAKAMTVPDEFWVNIEKFLHYFEELFDSRNGDVMIPSWSFFHASFLYWVYKNEKKYQRMRREIEKKRQPYLRALYPGTSGKALSESQTSSFSLIRRTNLSSQRRGTVEALPNIPLVPLLNPTSTSTTDVGRLSSGEGLIDVQNDHHNVLETYDFIWSHAITFCFYALNKLIKQIEWTIHRRFYRGFSVQGFLETSGLASAIALYISLYKIPRFRRSGLVSSLLAGTAFSSLLTSILLRYLMHRDTRHVVYDKDFLRNVLTVIYAKLFGGRGRRRTLRDPQKPTD
eukprot:g3673.t1